MYAMYEWCGAAADIIKTVEQTALHSYTQIVNYVNHRSLLELPLLHYEYSEYEQIYVYKREPSNN